MRASIPTYVGRSREVLPVVPLRDMVVFPHMMAPFVVGRDSSVRALEASLAAHLEAVNALLDPHERLDCLVVVTQPWTVESGLITPTFKVRRNRVEDVYAPYYDRWLVERRSVIWHEA